MNDLFTHSAALSKPEATARLRLIRTENIGPVTFRHLIERYGSAVEALKAIPTLAQQGGRKKPLRIPALSVIEQEQDALHRFGADILHRGHGAYPKNLAAVEDAPPVLFTKGHPSLLQKETIAIVGARNASAAGMKMARDIAGALSESDIVVVSGLARGIDTAAHHAAISGGTVACLAGGLDIVYPKENEALHDTIAQSGLLVSEMPLSTKPQARHFPRRNRLISGLSLGILVIEAAEKSGSLITARYAADQGREVFAVPGSPLDPRCQGTNRLIKDGAILTQSANDIIDEIHSLRRQILSEPNDLPLFDYLGDRQQTESLEPKDTDRQQITALLSHTPINIDELIRAAALPPATVLAILLELELASVVIRYPGNRAALID